MMADPKNAVVVVVAVALRTQAHSLRDLAHRVDVSGIGVYVIRSLIDAAESLEVAARDLDSGGQVRDAV